MTKQLFATLDVYHDESSRSAALNMAVDETLLECVTQPTIRFYRWDHPALSFGYFGKLADVASHANKRDVVRRWTGGGIVLHGADLTYSIVIPASDSAFAESSVSIYRKIHEGARAALASHGKTVATFCERRPEKNSAVIDRRYNKDLCFANPVESDLLSNGRKIAGAAQRRTRGGLLQQGSIQNLDLPLEFEKNFAAQLSPKCTERTLSESLLGRATKIATERYATAEWMRRR